MQAAPGPDSDQNGGRTAFHDLQSDIVTDGVADDDRDAHVAAEFSRSSDLYSEEMMAHRRDRALHDENIRARFLRDRAEFRRALRNRADRRDRAAVFDLADARRDQIFLHRFLVNFLQQAR